MVDFKLFQTHISDGNMNAAARFYPEGMSAEQRAKIFLERRIALGKQNGFNGRLMYMADQKTKDGSFKIIDEEYVRANPNGWSDIDEDILLMTSKTPGVVIGHPVADCPVVILNDIEKNVCAIAHCSAEMVNMKLPILEVEAIRSAFDSKSSDLIAYIPACAGSNWEYDRYPKWATDEAVWKNSIKLEGCNYHINIRKAIVEQLYSSDIETIVINPADTITDPLYYSNCAASKGIEYKKGRHFAGAYYK